MALWLRCCIPLAVLVSVTILAGCAYHPMTAQQLAEADPELRAIAAALEDTVAAAEADPDLHWRSGWFGNVITNVFGGDNKGLCYQWQEYVYIGVVPTVREVGWQAHGLAVNVRNDHEHHVVVVFDPGKHRVHEMLCQDADRSTFYVLEAWKRGEPHIFQLPVWLQMQPEPKPLQLEDMEAVLDASSEPWGRKR